MRRALRALPILLAALAPLACTAPGAVPMPPPGALPAGLAASAAPLADPGPVIRYRCGELDVDARIGDGAVELVIGDWRDVVPLAPAASGVKFERGIDAGYRLFWIKGDSARLAIGSGSWWICERRSGPAP